MSKRTSKHKTAAIALIETQLVATGKFLRPDRFGHYKTPDGNWRLKIQALSIRFERKGSGAEWYNIASGFFSSFEQARIDYILRRIS